MKRIETKKLTYCALMTALVFVATAFIPQIPVPFTNGYIHTGDSMIFVAAILLGWKYGAIAGGIGSAMADLTLGYYHWILPTLIIKSIMGAVVGLMTKKHSSNTANTVKNTLTVIIGGGWIVIGIFLKNILYKRLGDLQKSELAQYLIDEFDNIKNLNDLQNLVNYVQLALLIAIVVIPVIIVIVNIVMKRKDKELFSLSSLMGMSIAGLWMVIGYYFAGAALTGNFIVPIFSIPANIIQFTGGIIIAFPILLALKKTRYFNSI